MNKKEKSMVDRLVKEFSRTSDDNKENIISYIAGIADATARMKQREKNER